MKHKNRLLAWGQQYRYPFLSLSDGSHIAHGIASWRRASRNPKRSLLAWQRISEWQRRLQSERSA